MLLDYSVANEVWRMQIFESRSDNLPGAPLSSEMEIIENPNSMDCFDLLI